MAAQNVVNMASLLTNMVLPPDVQPVPVSLPNPPPLSGVLAPNDWLSRASAFANNIVSGPKSMIVVDGYVYTGQDDGWVVEVTPDGTSRRILRISTPMCALPNAPPGACGRPTGVDVDRYGYLIVADAYRGIFQINARTGRFRHLVDTRALKVNNKTVGMINDVAVAPDGTMFFTSGSSRWAYHTQINSFLEGETTGRVLVYNPRAKDGENVMELVTGLSLPTSVQLAKDNSYLLIAEGGRARVLRAWLGINTPKRGTLELFAGNLPGFVSSISLSPRDTYWVGMARSRFQGNPSIYDIHGDEPKVRGTAIVLLRRNMKFEEPKYGMILELDADGNTIRSLQDPKGTRFNSVSGVQELNGNLYISSEGKKFIGVLNLNSLPNGGMPLPSDQTTPQPKNAMEQLLEIVNTNLQKLTDIEIRNVVFGLIQRLYLSKTQVSMQKMTITKLQQMVQALQQQLSQLQQGTGNTTAGTPAGTTGGTTTPSLPVTTPTTGGGATVPSTTQSTTQAGATTAAPTTTAAPQDVASTAAPTQPPTTTDAPTQAPTTTAPPATSAPTTQAPTTQPPTTATTTPVEG